MASSQLLLQRFVIPQNPIAKVGFVSCCLTSRIGYRNIPFTSISWSHSVQKHSTGFVVRAESEPQENAQNVEQEEEEQEEEEQEEVSEPKSARKPRVKLGDIMGILHKRAIEASEKERATPDIRTGDIVEIKLEVPENKRRLSIYKGIVISRQNSGIHTTIRIRRIIAGVGVEIVFPIYSPNIKEIKVVSHRKVRRARLYYLRHKLPRLSTFK
ncbi:putative ribosomal protein L19 [Lupinus albus]|uniref:Putative ribosomal protein L19 n=1 Tax=Lupinus albus TaxID=3870 RepID=A0A6A4QFL3_LUPAL|nr:putative ribosomal protein L19 [Lupinus albus]